MELKGEKMYNKILPTDFQSKDFIVFRVGDYWIKNDISEWEEIPDNNEVSLEEFTNCIWNICLTSDINQALKFNYDENITIIKSSFWLPKYFPSYTYHSNDYYQTSKNMTLKELKEYLEELFQHEVNIIWYTKTIKTSYNIHSMNIDEIKIKG